MRHATEGDVLRGEDLPPAKDILSRQFSGRSVPDAGRQSGVIFRPAASVGLRDRGAYSLLKSS